MQYASDFDLYWTHTRTLGEGDVAGQKSLIRLHLHQSEEPFYHHEKLFPIVSHRHGERPPRGAKRTYCHAKP
jgi:hypothetical protein